MLELGVPVSLGCDGGPSNNTYDMVREMRVAALVHKSIVDDPLVVSAEDVIEMATIGGARAMGIEDRVGSLESEKLADLIIFDMNDLGLTPRPNPVSNLVYSGSGHYVDTVMVNGTLLLRNKRLLTIDEEDVMRRANDQIVDLLDRSDLRIEPKWPIR
jgi:cytosine/adenosine deaminase-related metal-dependent hydrolase